MEILWSIKHGRTPGVFDHRLCFVRLLHVSDDRDEQRVSSLTRGHSAVRRANNAGDKCQRIWCYCGPAWIY